MDNNFSEKIHKARESLLGIREIDISNENLGPDSGFQNAEVVKNRIVSYFLELLKSIQLFGDKINPIILEDKAEAITAYSKMIHESITRLNSVVNDGLHNEKFPKRRIGVINDFLNLEKKIISNFSDFQTKIDIAKLESSNPNENALDNILRSANAKIQDADDKIQEITKIGKDVDKVLENLRRKASTENVKQSVTNFNKQFETHRNYEIFWFLITAIVAFVIIKQVSLFLENDIDIIEPIELFVFYSKRFIAIAVSLIFFRIALVRYNLERNLKIIYLHRETVLSQYNDFEATIGDDSEAKNAFRLEIAKYIFSDPQTGYLGKDSGSGNININPIINAADKVAKNFSPSK